MENSNNEQKSVEELAKERYPFLNMETKSDTRKKRNAFIAGHTAATEGKVKKDEVKDLAVILDLLHMASDGWYSDEVYNKTHFKSYREQERHVRLLIKKLSK